MARSKNPTRDILLSLAAAGVFAAGLISYVMHGMPSKQELETSYRAPQAGAEGPDDLEVARPVVNAFFAALESGRLEDAYALMAPPFHATTSFSAFRAACAGSPFLAKARRAVLFSTRRILPNGAQPGPYSVTGRGVIESAAGSVNTDVTLLVNGRDARILVLSIAGVPVLNGVNASAPAR